jgi:hypothetical protein
MDRPVVHTFSPPRDGPERCGKENGLRERAATILYHAAKAPRLLFEQNAKHAALHPMLPST